MTKHLEHLNVRCIRPIRHKITPKMRVVLTELNHNESDIIWNLEP